MIKENKLIHSKYENAANVNWLRRAGTAGFVFFLAKGLLWIVAIVWAAY